MSNDAAGSADRPVRLRADVARQWLRHERNTRIARIDQLTVTGDSPSAAVGEKLALQIRAVRRVLREIDAALERVEDDTYGLCRRCGRPIPVERLEILPYADCCVGCRRYAV